MPCPYCNSAMTEDRCSNCGYICSICGTPSKEQPCPNCGHGSFQVGYSPTGSPAPAQSPELSDVQRIFGRTPSRKEFNMVRGMIDRDRERIHRLTELLCDRFPAPLSRELIEMRTLQVRKRVIKGGSDLTHAEGVIFSFLEAAKQAGMVEFATRALAEAQLLDGNLRLGLSNVRLSSLKFVVEVSGDFYNKPILLVDGEPRSCKVVELEARTHSRTYMLLWRPLLADCLGGDFDGVVRVSAAIEREDATESIPLKISWRDSLGEKHDRINLLMDPKKFFYGFTKRKEVEVDAGVPAVRSADSDANVMLKRIGKQLDSLRATALLFSVACGSMPSGAIWSVAREIIAKQSNSEVAVTPRKKAAAAIVAADMRCFVGLDDATRARLAFMINKLPLVGKDTEYTSARGLIVPSEFSAAIGIEWHDAFSLAVKLE